VEFNNKAFDLGARSDLSVNPSTFGMEIQLPLGNYPGRAGASLPITLSYSSKVWRLDYNFYNPGHYSSNGTPIGDGYTGVVARYAEHSAAGWTSSLGFPFFDNIPTQYYNFDGRTRPDPNSCSGVCYVIDRLLLLMPDGSSHELRSSDQPKALNDPTPLPDDLYAVDGSRMRYQRSTQTLFMPNGSRYLFGSLQYVDRNGNALTYDTANSRWLDTLGRPINLPPLSTTAGSSVYSLPGVNNSTINYTFVWKNLGDAGMLSTAQQLQYTADSACPPGNGSFSPRLFWSDSGNRTCIINAGSVFNPVVLYQIQLPTGGAYTFTYNVYGEIDKVQLPTGGYERYEYSQIPSINLTGPFYAQANRGVVNRFVSASGSGSDEVASNYSGAGINPIRITAPDNSLVERYIYRIITVGPVLWSYTPEEARSGMAFDERYYSAPDSGGIRHMLRRKLAEWSMTGSNAVGQINGADNATRNARITKQVEINFDSGGSALAKTIVHEYDLTQQFSSGANEVATKEYDYIVMDQATAQTIDIGSVPTGALLRQTVKTYVDAANQSYRDRNLLGLVNSVTVKDAAENVIAQTSTSYDEGGPYAQLSDYASVTNWTDPQTSVRGNPTTVSRWLNFDGSSFSAFPNGTYLASHQQYDQCGSVRTTWDAKNNQSRLSYADSFTDYPRNTYAYPTNATTAVPDASGTYGSNTAFTTTSVYDFNTGRVMSSSDANGQTTTYDYTDPLNRIRRVTGPNGARMRYNYFTTPGDLYIQVLTDEDTRSIETRTYFDSLGRAVRKFLYDGTPSTPWSVTDTYYDTMGRVSQVSNPYRTSTPGAGVPATCSVCTTNAYDALGRVITVTTPDGAHVTSAYSGSTSGTLGTTVTVTDQAGRLRRSLTDAIGRLVRVDEPDKDTGNLDDGSGPVQPTYYTYDILGNLKRVDQGSQHRYFLYDSLSRLLRARNPEQGVASANNLNDPYGDPAYPNSQWSTAYAYDANGNLLTHTDARGVVTTYAYDQLNRNTSVSYANDPAGTPATNRYYDGWRDGTHNSTITNSKGKLWQTETAGATGVRTTTDSYDVVGRPGQQEQQFKTTSGWSAPYITSQTYDLGNHVVSQTYPSGRAVNYNYDVAGRLADKDPTHLALRGNLGDGVDRIYATGIAYDPASRLTLEQYGTTTPLYNKLFYNVRGQLAEIRVGTYNATDPTWWNRGAIINHYSNNYGCWGASCNAPDNNGNLMKQEVYIPNDENITTSTMHWQQYDYDKLNRINWVREIINGAEVSRQTFSYDRFGNRTINTNSIATYGGVNNRAFEVEPETNRLLASGDLAQTDLTLRQMQYDSAGNLKKDTYTGAGYRVYDAENRMTQAQGGTGSSWQYYIYDGDGRRVKRIVDGVETWQIYGLGGELIAEYGANTDHLSPQKEYGYRNGQLLVAAGSETTSAAPPTGLGATSNSGNVTLSWTGSGAVKYRVERKAAGGSFTFFDTTTTPSIADNTAANGSAYLYKVCSANNAGTCTSDYSNVVLGARFYFPTDSTLCASSDNPPCSEPTAVKHEHINELRDAINAVRALAGDSAAWVGQTVHAGDTIYKDDVQDLRTKLDESLQHLNIQTSSYDNNPLAGAPNGTLIKAVHIRQLRQRATSGTGNSGSGGSGATFSVHWLVGDQLGTPRMIFDQSGSLASMTRHDYLPFGEELFAGTGGRTTAQGYSASDGIRQQFTGQQRDTESSLDYFSSRYYSSSQGRFTSADVFGTRRRNPQSWNRYSYVLNNPLRYNDPLGFFAQDPQNPKIDPEDIIKIFIKQKKDSVLKRIFGKIGGLFKGGSRVQSEEGEPEEGKPEEVRDEERKADEKDLYERQPGMDPNGVPPVQVNPLDVIIPGLEDPEEARDMEDASLVPRLNGKSDVERLADALKRVAASEGSPEAKAEMFARFASQINQRSTRDWRAQPGRGDDGSWVWIGARQPQGTNMVVISPTGQVFVGNAATALHLTSTGGIPQYNLLRPFR
jgi:RHS repeat-associated protein